jgi:hypothetical protein
MQLIRKKRINNNYINIIFKIAVPKNIQKYTKRYQLFIIKMNNKKGCNTQANFVVTAF